MIDEITFQADLMLTWPSESRGHQRPPESARKDAVVEGGGRAGGGWGGWRTGGCAAPRQSALGLHPERRQRALRAAGHHQGNEPSQVEARTQTVTLVMMVIKVHHRTVKTSRPLVCNSCEDEVRFESRCECSVRTQLVRIIGPTWSRCITEHQQVLDQMSPSSSWNKQKVPGVVSCLNRRGPQVTAEEELIFNQGAQVVADVDGRVLKRKGPP